MPKTFCVVGHDARQQAAARVLRRAGYGVTAADNAAAADYILLPMSQGRVSDEVARALQGAGQGTLILAGRPGMPVRMAAREAGLPLIDYFLRPELECLNAVPTAEGCLELLLRLRERTIWESGFLVLGYGRVGRAVARRLVLLGGRVTVAARSPEQRANARCAGCRAAPLTALPTLLPGFDAVINTIPAPVLPRALLQELPGGALIAFTGGLGAGKTAFCQGLAEGLGCTDPVSSPTFAIVNYYRGPRPLAHFDLYRIHTENDLAAAGFYDYLDMGAVVACEWSENCADLLEQEQPIHIHIDRVDETTRKITIS